MAAIQRLDEKFMLERDPLAPILAAWAATVRRQPNAAALLERADSVVRGWAED